MSITFQASDLSQKRREFINKARSGLARLRDTDGISLVMVPEKQFSVLEEIAHWSKQHLNFERALSIPEKNRKATDFGQLTWLRVFDNDDLLEFKNELEEALHIAISERSLDILKGVIDSWRATANSLTDPLRSEVLLGKPENNEFVEVDRPEESK